MAFTLDLVAKDLGLAGVLAARVGAAERAVAEGLRGHHLSAVAVALRA